MPISPQELLAGRQSAEGVQLNKIASGCASYGEELALMKIAETEMKAQEDGEEEGKEEEKLDEEEKKEAAAMGLFALDGFIDKLASAGDLVYNDPTVYIRALAEERGAYAKVAAVADGLRAGYEATKGAITRGYGHARDFGKDVGGMYANPSRFGGNLPGGRAAAVKAVAGGLPGAAIGAGTGALAGGEDNRGTGALVGGLMGGAAGGAGGAFGGKLRQALHSKKGLEAARAARGTKQVQRSARNESAERFEAGMQPGGAFSDANGNFVHAANGSVLDLLVASRDSGILSQY